VTLCPLWSLCPWDRLTIVSCPRLRLSAAPKRLELLHELIPTATVIALLVNPADPTIAEANSSAVVSTAHRLGLELHVLNASSELDFDTVFANLIQLRAGGLVIGGGALFTARIEQLAALTAHYAVPAIHGSRSSLAAARRPGFSSK
jgi:putative ABC transport system substrate-binding protein